MEKEYLDKYGFENWIALWKKKQKKKIPVIEDVFKIIKEEK